MSQVFVDPSQEYESFSWIEVWTKAPTKPSVDTYERLVRDPNASATTAIIWVFISSAVGFILTVFLSLAITTLFDVAALGTFDSELLSGFTIVVTVCLAPISAVLAVAGLLLYAGIAHVFARLLGGTGSYSDLVYAYGAFMAPLSLLTSILVVIPYLNFCLSIPVAIFYLILAVIAVSAVNQFGTGKSLISVVIGPIGIAVFVGCGVIFLLTLAGPQIGDVFSSIIEELSTPTP